MTLPRSPGPSILSQRIFHTPRLNVQSRAFATIHPNQTRDIYDVVIVGGGPAGLSLASALRSSYITSSLRVALVEGGALEPMKEWKPQAYSNRVSSLTPQSIKFMETIGAWKHIRRDRVQAYHGMKVWDGVSGSEIIFDSSLQETSNAIAYMTENTNLVAALLARLRELGAENIMDRTRVESISFGEDNGDVDLRSWPTVETSTGKKLTTRLLVGADGAESPVRKFAEIGTNGWDYGRHGVVATLKLHPGVIKNGITRTAYQRFLPTGPVAMLPRLSSQLPGDFASLVWTTTPQIAATLKSFSQQDFVSMVNAAFRLNHIDLQYIQGLADGIEQEVAWREESTIEPEIAPQKVVSVQENSIASFPLKLRHADSYISERIALVGDAAHTTHPLAGLGLNQGIGDVQSLIKTIETSVRQGQDIGSTLSLEPYFSEQYIKNNMQLGVVDKLHKLYSTTSEPLVALRSVGLSTINRLSPLKKMIMDYTTGHRL